MRKAIILEGRTGMDEQEWRENVQCNYRIVREETNKKREGREEEKDNRESL